MTVTPRGDRKTELRNVLKKHGLQRTATSSDTGNNCYSEAWSQGLELVWKPTTFELKIPRRLVEMDDDELMLMAGIAGFKNTRSAGRVKMFTSPESGDTVVMHLRFSSGRVVIVGTLPPVE